jgi:carboxylesterase type B
LAFLPVIDEATLPRHPADTLADAGIDLMIGWTSDEASLAFGMNRRSQPRGHPVLAPLQDR